MIQTTNVRFYSLKYSSMKAWQAAALFIAGNMVMPQLFHLIPQGGTTWLPIYFFTLIGAYKYGWRVGMITAVASPLANSLLFGMPPVAGLPAIILKSVLLAVAAGTAASRFRKASLPLLLLVVLTYQITGTLGEWIMSDSLYAAFQDFRIGIPGMLLQVIGGWAVINHVIRR